MQDAKKTEMYRTVFWTLGERARVGWFGRMAFKHTYYHMWNESPVHVQCMRQGVRGWCTGMTQRDGMGKEVGGGFRMGNRCTPVVYSCQCMAKPLQYCKVIIFQLKNKERKRTFKSVFEPTNKDISDTTVYFYNQFYSILQLKVFVCLFFVHFWLGLYGKPLYYSCL